MSCLSWNCQGLGDTLAVRSLCNLVQVTKPQLVFLSETKATSHFMNSIRIKLGFIGGLHVDRIGYGGGLSLMWTDSLDVSILSYSSGHIDARILDDLGRTWRFTGFYGHPKLKERHHSWTLLRRLASLQHLPWLCAGDFNEVMYQHEKDGARPASLSQMDAFKTAVEDSELQDLGTVNGTYTWFGRRYSTDVRERLDRALANHAWLKFFPNASVTLRSASKSDHLALHISFEHCHVIPSTECSYVHRFETYWTKDEECREVMEFEWQPRSPITSKNLMAAIQSTRKALKKWSSDKYGYLPKLISSLRTQLQNMLQEPNSSEAEISQLRTRLQDLEHKEETFWRQRSRVEWLQFGDKNTRYFHHKTNARRHKNRISSITDNNGIVHTNFDNIAQTFQSFFVHLFTAPPGDLSALNALEFAQLTHSSKEFLSSPFSQEDVNKAVNDLPATKAPGSDGMQLLFLKQYWDILGGDVSAFVLRFLNEGGDLEDLNHTLICLIPKVKCPTTVTEYRPISLCNSIYKLISRVLVNRLKSVVAEVIDPSQSAFVPGRLITDNAAIAIEAFHVLKTQQPSGRKYASLKIDMAKAFDKVQWSYLEAVMLRMNFPENFVSRIMTCISSTTLSLLINGKATRPFKPTCGIRQGDPLSPFLFIICAEGFSSLIRSEVTQNSWQGMQFGRGGPCVSHLFFADDSLLFVEATQGALDSVRRVLNSYSLMSGQQINYHKSTAYFSKNVTIPETESLCSLTGISRGMGDSLYLGLPYMIGRSKKQIFQFVIDRVRKKLNGWKEKLLTKAGKEVLLKSVIHAIPNHVMQCFQLPGGVLDDILSLIRRFWWGKSCDSGAICWKSWDEMCSPKSMGGMGFKDLRISNLALLAKQGWRLIKEPDSLLGRVFKARYYPRDGFMKAGLGSKPSYLWRSIVAGREVLQLGMRYQVGTGENISVWDDKWIPLPFTFQPQPVNRHFWPNARVHELTIAGTNEWNHPLISQLFLPYEVQAIQQIPLHVEAIHDQVVWHHTSNGLYSVKSGYSILRKYRSSQWGEASHSWPSKKSIWNTLWAWPCQPKIKHFLWRAMHNLLPVGSNLHKRLSLTVVCPHCGCLCETDKHLFYDCPFSRKVWSSLGLAYLWHHPSATSFDSLLTFVLTQEEKQTAEIFVVVVWLLWKTRCKMHYERKETRVDQLISMASNLVQEVAATYLCKAPAHCHSSVWIRPSTGCYTINVDAAVSENGSTAYGAIIRNSLGAIVTAISGPSLQHISVEHAELRAMLEGLLLAKTCNVGDVILVTDSLLAYNRVGSKQVDLSLLSPLVEKIRIEAEAFNSVSYAFVKREGNLPAHMLAALGLNMSTIVNWGSMPPLDVIRAVNFDNVKAYE